MAKNRPKSFSTSAYAELTSAVPRGEFRRYDAKEDLPTGISKIAGFSGDDEYRTTLVMSNTTTGAPPSIGGITPASSAPIFRVSAIKWDQHSSDGAEHFNQYESLIFQDVDGQPWRLFAADQPGHFEELSTDSSLGAALVRYDLPPITQGPISILRSHGKLVDFSTGGIPSSRSS